MKTVIFTTEHTEDTEEYIFTMKDLKSMKIIHESVNERGNGRIHSLTPVFDSFRVFSCFSWLKLYSSVFSVNSVVNKGFV